MNVGIVGLGLIGGSMAKSIKARTAHTVWGVDLDSETMSLARMCGAIDAPLTDDNLPQCDLILIAIRPGAAIEWTRRHAELIAKSAALVDLCGVKRVVVGGIAPVAEQYGFAYIGGHPMAGKERGGFTSATEDLYVGASMILTPDSLDRGTGEQPAKSDGSGTNIPQPPTDHARNGQHHRHKPHLPVAIPA